MIEDQKFTNIEETVKIKFDRIKARLFSSLCLLEKSRHPWRANYLRYLNTSIDEALSIGQEKMAGLLLERLETMISAWTSEDAITLPSPPAQKPNEKDGHLDCRLREFLLEQQKRCPSLLQKEEGLGENLSSGLSLENWERYLDWNKAEIQYWEIICSGLQRRIKFLQELDFHDFLQGNWGPYNQQYTLIKALRCLKSLNPQWLEEYLLLYESLRSFEVMTGLLSSSPQP